VVNKKKRILYINYQYRSYDKLKYETLADNYDLKVIWLFPFRETDILPEFIRCKIQFRVLGFKNGRLEFWHFFYNIKLFFLILVLGKDVQLIMSSTSDGWQSKIAFLANLFLRKAIAYRKEVWFENSTLKSYIRSWFTKVIERRANMIFTPGIKQKEFLIRNGIEKSKIQLFPYLIEDFRTNPVLKGEGIIKLLYVGRIIPLKGVDLLIKSFKKIEERFANVELHIIGGASKGPYEPENSEDFFMYCKNMAKNNKKILFHGEMSPNKTIEYIAKSDILILPVRKHLDGKKRLIGEGWGNVIVEAASQGLPIIASDRVPSAYELVENNENGFIIDSDNIQDELINKITFFANNSLKIRDFGRKSRIRYEKYNQPIKIVNSINYLFKEN